MTKDIEVIKTKTLVFMTILMMALTGCGKAEQDQMVVYSFSGEDKQLAVILETIVVAWDFMLEDSRCLYLLFSRTWGGDDSDDNGIGVCCINEEIKEIAYKDMAF